jgi:hypothetical protein
MGFRQLGDAKSPNPDTTISGTDRFPQKRINHMTQNLPNPLVVRPVTRSVILISLFLLTTSVPWIYYAGAPYIPIKTLMPFALYFVQTYILRMREGRVYDQILEVFLVIPELRNLAVPPEKGGPQNQMVLVFSGFSVLGTLLLTGIPLDIFQFAGLMLSLSSTFGFVVSMIGIEGFSILDLPVAVFGHILVTFLGLSSVLLSW